MNALLGPGSGMRLGAAARRAGVALAVFAVAVAAGCKTPRTPHRTVDNDVSGTWSAQTRVPVPIGWSFRLDQGHAGTLSGSGTRNDGSAVETFGIDGVRGPQEITMDLDLEGVKGRFDGSVMSVDLIVGRVFLDGDTIPMTLERR